MKKDSIKNISWENCLWHHFKKVYMKFWKKNILLNLDLVLFSSVHTHTHTCTHTHTHIYIYGKFVFLYVLICTYLFIVFCLGILWELLFWTWTKFLKFHSFHRFLPLIRSITLDSVAWASSWVDRVHQNLFHHLWSLCTWGPAPFLLYTLHGFQHSLFCR